MAPSSLDLGRDLVRATTDPFAAAASEAARGSRLAAKKKQKAKKRTPKKKAKRPPVCTKKDLATKRSKRRKCRVVKKKVTTPVRSSPTGPITAPPAAAASPDAFPTAPAAAPAAGLPTHTGTFGVREATRLLFRAGFGPTPGQAEALASLGVRGAVTQLLNPGPARLVGPAPSGDFLVGGQFAVADRYGHLHLSTFDRQIRSTDGLGERMTLVLHDWFAVSEAGADRKFMAPHLQLLRAGWRGSFRQLLLDVTQDPAMLEFLDGTDNRRGAPNENYAREVMELYALGADRGAYTETDVREMARALTGFRNDFSDALGAFNFRYDPSRHDNGVKTVFGGTAQERTGALSWQDAIHAVVDHPLHPSFVVRKLWSYFIPTEPTDTTQLGLEGLYRSSGEQLGPLVEAILLHPDLHAGPAMVKPPLVYAAGLLRSVGLGITTDNWVYRLDGAGQVNGDPPNVSGWNDRAWLNTSTHAARWGIVQEVLGSRTLTAAGYRGLTESAPDALDSALAWWGRPQISPQLEAAARRVAQEAWAPRVTGDQYGNLETFLAHRQNTLRQMIAASPDFQVA